MGGVRGADTAGVVVSSTQTPSLGDRARAGARRRAAAPIVLVAAALSLYAVLSTATSGDYQLHGAGSGDNAAPALYALVHGRLGVFLARQPLMGLSSLLLRAPVAWAGVSLGAGPLLVYRLGALACMLPAAALASWLALDARRRGAPLTGALAALIVVVGSPTLAALAAGHPEEVLAATLAAGTLLAAERGHPALAGALAGVALGTKEWALVALPALALALPDGRARLRAVAAGLPPALALGLGPALANPAAFERAARTLGDSRLVTALSVWWPLASRPLHPPPAAALAGTLPPGLDKTTALAIGLVLAAAAVLALAALAQRRRGWLRRSGRRVDPLGLLCLLALTRCLADPAPVQYYYVAVGIPLACWESAVRGRPPAGTLGLLAALWLLYERGPGLVGAGAESALTLGLGVVALAWLGAKALWNGLPARDPRRAPRVEQPSRATLAEPIASAG